MKVKNKEMYHIHRNGVYDDIWQVGNEVIVDEDFITLFNSDRDVPSGVRCKDGSISSLDRFIEKVIKGLDTDEKILNLKQLSDEEFVNKGKYFYYMLKDCMVKIRSLALKNREEALEAVRKEKYPKLPSRYHCIWVCNEENLDFWLSKLRKDSIIYKVELNGELFKSSDSFLPEDGEKKENQKIEADKYWNPKFTDDDQERTAEYLFQGKVKILEKLKWEKTADKNIDMKLKP